jgi:hypothetical protein
MHQDLRFSVMTASAGAVGAIAGVVGFVLEGLVGVLVGALCLSLWTGVQKLREKLRGKTH